MRLVPRFFAISILILNIPPLLGQNGAEIRKDGAAVEFFNVTDKAGIKWGYKTLAPGVKYLIETMGGGGGFIDYDNDGLLDIYLVCYSQTQQADPNTKLRDVLYHNNGDGTFTDVTDKAGIANSMLG